MTGFRRLSTIALSASLLAVPLASAGCDTTPAPKVADVRAGDMPAGATWTGVYYSELYGYLHLVQVGTSIQGKWIRPVKDRWGELSGTVIGDLFHFQWTEHLIGGVGPGATRTGKGYFKYKRPPGELVDDLIGGEIGSGSDELGSPWDGVKQRNHKPDLKSIGGTDAADIGGGDWDRENTEPGKPEAPKPPPAR